MSRNELQPTTATASGFPSAQRPMDNHPMDNDTAATVQQAPTDAALQDVNSSDPDGISSQKVGSGYTGNEEAGAGQEVQYVVIAPLVIVGSPAASASQDEATNEFVLIVPESGAIGSDQSAASEENIPAAE